jgi:hypothetical protein
VTTDSHHEEAQETIVEAAMLSQAQVRAYVRSRFWTVFLSGAATAVCVSWLERLLLTVL